MQYFYFVMNSLFGNIKQCVVHTSDVPKYQYSVK